MTKAEQLADAAALAVPEIAIPAELGKQLLAAHRKAQTSRQTAPAAPPQISTVIEGQAAGPVVINLPADPLFVIKKSSVRVITRKGQQIIVAKPAHGVSAKEAILVALIGGGAYVAWKVGGKVNSDLSAALQGPHSTASFPASINPTTWRL